MLSWSSQEQGIEVDLATVQHQSMGINFAVELNNFATAATQLVQTALSSARDALVDAAGISVMIDASAVIANFEMMTRLADSTGARMSQEVVSQRLGIAIAMGVDQVVSRR